MEYKTPAGGVASFYRLFGGHTNVELAAASIGIVVTPKLLTHWKQLDAIPAHIFNALSSLITIDESKPIFGHIEFYYDGKPLGKFYMDKNVTAILRKKK